MGTCLSDGHCSLGGKDRRLVAIALFARLCRTRLAAGHFGEFTRTGTERSLHNSKGFTEFGCVRMRYAQLEDDIRGDANHRE
jgi:hypothetical protein